MDWSGHQPVLGSKIWWSRRNRGVMYRRDRSGRPSLDMRFVRTHVWWRSISDTAELRNVVASAVVAPACRSTSIRPGSVIDFPHYSD